MQQIDNGFDDLTLRGALDPRHYFPRNARQAAIKIRRAAIMLGEPDHPARLAADVVATTIEAYADEIEKMIKGDEKEDC